jgi:type I restriction enzyme R subunit
MAFELFDPQRDLRIHRGSLPHWFQPGVTYFITFRTNDSLPAEVADLWYRRRNDWLRRHRIDPASKHWRTALRQLPDHSQREFHQRFIQAHLASLDRGHGECVLQYRELAEIVANTLRHFDGDRYQLGDYVIMPNHVHLLACLLGATDIERQCYSWKKFSATQINKRLGRRGRFWQEESFDHLVRSPEQFDYLRHYIAANPQEAGLREGQYLYHSAP